MMSSPLHAIPRLIVSRTLRWLAIGWYETLSGYGRTMLSVAWVPISNLALVLTLTLVFGRGEGGDPYSYFIYVLIGFTMWQLVLDSLTQSTNVIQLQLDFANHNRITLLDLFIKGLAMRMIRFFLNVAVTAALVFIMFFEKQSAMLLLFIPFVIISAATSLGLAYLINVVTLMVQDAERVLQSSSRFLFFLSPVFWSVPSGSEDTIRAFLVTYNPIAYYLSCIRQVFGIIPIDVHDWIVVLGVSGFVIVAFAIVYQMTNRIVRNIS